MRKSNLILLLLSLVSAMFGVAACGGFDLDCDPEFDEGCVCTLDDSGLATDDCIDGETADGELCTCALEGNNDVNNDSNNVNNDVNNDANNDTPLAFRFVLVEDRTDNVSGDFPGSDIDAIGLIKGDGSGEVFASSVEEDSDVSCEGNLACDTNALTGAPDVVDGGNCFGGGAPDGSLFTALNQGFVIVGFGGNTIENGDSIHVYEIGATECGRFDDDPFKVSVSVSDNIDGFFLELGFGGEGNNRLLVSGL